jgi:vancomycin resistance protein YoaR
VFTDDASYPGGSGRPRPARRAHRRTAAILIALVALHPAPGSGDEPTAAAPDAASENAFPVALGAFSTTLAGSAPGRTHNIRLACAALDGTVLEPGDRLSFNRVVGPRSAARGYVDAPVILRESRQLQLGGGICQVASTLFAAGLLSGLAVVERHRHSTPVDYIELGQDATVSWKVKDLVLRNDLEQRVRVRLDVLGSTLTARLEGESPLDETYELVSDVRETPDALAGAPGREIDLYRVRRVNGEEVDRLLVHKDVYPIARVRAADAP